MFISVSSPEIWKALRVARGIIFSFLRMKFLFLYPPPSPVFLLKFLFVRTTKLQRIVLHFLYFPLSTVLRFYMLSPYQNICNDRKNILVTPCI